MRPGWLKAAACTAILGVPALNAQSSVLSGRVFDSLRMAPLAGVTVHLSGTPYAVRTGLDGTYRLVTELKGLRTVTLSEPRLDRLLGTVSGEVNLAPGSEVHFSFSIPSRPPSPSTLCVNQSTRPAAAGGVLGVVRDSATGLPISGALVAACWTPDSTDTTGVRRGLKVESGEDGGFLLCSLPTDRPVSLLARTPAREIGLDGLRLSPDTIMDLDLLGRTVAAPAAVGRLRGKVTDSATGTALAGADIMLIESGLHGRSNAGGDFSIEQVLPGQTAVVVRHIGYRPEFLHAVLEAGGTAEVNARLRPAPFRLEDLETRIGTIEYEGFLERRHTGVGKYWETAEIRRNDGRTMSALLGSRANIREDRGGILINYSRGNCRIPVVMNGVLWPAEAATGIRPDQLDAVEFYGGPAQVPNDFQSLHLRANAFRCGLLVVWSRGLK